ncbi:MAG: FAD-dependent oxidoreductase [Chloroflexia bacterium]|nr:FAD-dependent oxidoreductase [Chloroflexia bacterium]
MTPPAEARSNPNASAAGALPVVVVGAGMAGLVCALALHETGQRMLLLEAADGVGGRVRTDVHPEGFIIDRGFQILLDAYPAARRWVDHPALRPMAFDIGAHVWSGKRLLPLADPFRHPSGTLRDLTSPVFPLADKLRLARLGARVVRSEWQSAAAATAEAGAVSAVEQLWGEGFTPSFVDRFARPFWGGILLDPALAAAAGPLLFTLKMFLTGRAVLPNEGIGAMPAQLARRLPPESVRLGAAVDRLIRDDGEVVGVQVGGEAIRAAAVVVATDPPTARQLTGDERIPGADRGLGCLTVFLAAERDPAVAPRLILDGTRRGVVNHLAPLSAVQPSYAPPGQHLLAAVVVGDALARDDDDLAQTARVEAASMLGQDAAAWRVLAVRRIPFSQFAQPPGGAAALPPATMADPGLYLASEATVDSSYNGAILGGEAAARAVLRDLARRGRPRSERGEP